MRLSVLGGVVVGLLSLTASACGGAEDDPHGRYTYVDSCRLVKDGTVAGLSAGLPESPQPSTGGPNRLPYDFSVCRLSFGSKDSIVARGEPSATAPAYRDITVTAYRYSANEKQSAAQRAKILIGTLVAPDNRIDAPHGNVDELYFMNLDYGAVSTAEAWVLAGNVVLDIAYARANANGVPPTVTGDDGRDGVLALVRDAAELLPCVTPDDDFDPGKC